MKNLNLDNNVITNHDQKYKDSCVSMSVEFIVKLVDPSQINYYNQQLTYQNGGIGGSIFNNQTINNITFSHQFNQPRGYAFPLTNLFHTIKDELDNDRYVQIALVSGKPTATYINYHCWIVYGYNDKGEFSAITKYFNQPQPVYITNVRQQLTAIGGSDILIYR